MARLLLNNLNFLGIDLNGEILPHGKVYINTSAGNPTDSYTTSSLATKNTNPVVLSASGTADIYLDDGTYTIILTDKDDVVVKEVSSLTIESGKAIQVENDLSSYKTIIDSKIFDIEQDILLRPETVFFGEAKESDYSGGKPMLWNARHDPYNMLQGDNITLRVPKAGKYLCTASANVSFSGAGDGYILINATGTTQLALGAIANIATNPKVNMEATGIATLATSGEIDAYLSLSGATLIQTGLISPFYQSTTITIEFLGT